MPASLDLLHPHAWLDSIPETRWDARLNRYVRPWHPVHMDGIAKGYIAYLRGVMDSHAYRTFTEAWTVPDVEELGALAAELENAVLDAAPAAQIKFWSRPSLPRQVVAGELSSVWLRMAARKSAERAFVRWDPAEANRRHVSAIRGGQKSKRPKIFSVADLPPGSIRAQAEALGCSRATVCRLRREAKAVGA